MELIKKSLFLVIMAFLANAQSVRAETPAQALKVLTLNFNDEDVLLDPDNQVKDFRFEALVNWVKQNDPDIILMQEVWEYRGDASVGITLAQALGYDLNYRLDMGAPLLLYDSNVILAKKSLKMKNLAPLKLPHSALELGDGKTWIISLGTISYAIGSRLTLNNGEPLYVYTSHLIAENDSERNDQIKAVDRRIRKQLKKDGQNYSTAKIIFGGDLNAHTDTDGIQYLLKNGYQDTWSQAHPGDTSCTNCANPLESYFNPFTIGANQFPDQSDETISERIDYIFAKGVGQKTLASTLTFTSPQSGIWMSDHYGLVSVIGMGGTPEGDYPNPTRDFMNPIADATVLKADDTLFGCNPDDRSKPCSVALPEIEVTSVRGLALLNQSKQGLEFHIRGPGKIYTDKDADLDSGDVAAFTFSTPGDFKYTIENDDGVKRHGLIHVRSVTAD